MLAEACNRICLDDEMEHTLLPSGLMTPTSLSREPNPWVCTNPPPMRWGLGSRRRPGMPEYSGVNSVGKHAGLLGGSLGSIKAPRMMGYGRLAGTLMGRSRGAALATAADTFPRVPAMVTKELVPPTPKGSRKILARFSAQVLGCRCKSSTAQGRARGC